MGVQPNPTKHSVVVIVRAILTNSLRKNKYYMKDITFIRFIPVIHADNPEHTLSFSGGRLCPRQVYSRVTSDSDMWSWPGYANEFSTLCYKEGLLKSGCYVFWYSDFSLARLSYFSYIYIQYPPSVTVLCQIPVLNICPGSCGFIHHRDNSVRPVTTAFFVFWNKLPCDIRSSQSKTSFKQALKTHLFSTHY